MRIIKGIKAFILLSSCLFLSETLASGQEVVNDPVHTGVSIANQAENHASWLEQLENGLEQVSTAKAQLESAIEQNRWMRGAYDLAQFSKTYGPAVRTLYDTYDEYAAMVRYSNSAIKSAYNSGWMSGTDVRYIIEGTDRSQRLVKASFLTLAQMIKDENMTQKERLRLIQNLTYTIQREKGWLQKTYDWQNKKRQYRYTLALTRAMADGNYDSGITLEDDDSGIMDGIDAEQSAWAAAITQASSLPEIKELLKRINDKEHNAETEKKTLDNLPKVADYIRPAINFTTYAIALVLLFSLPMAFARRNRGERQANDALYKIYIALIFAIVSLQILKLILV